MQSREFPVYNIVVANTNQGGTMKNVRKDTIRNLYREGLRQVFGCDDRKMDSHLIKALDSDIHIAGQGPGGWVDDAGVLEIYCENGIPNASDIHDFRAEAEEFGIDPSDAVSYNSDKWHKVDKWVNLALKGMASPKTVFHEPCNSAVVAIHWDS